MLVPEAYGCISLAFRHLEACPDFYWSRRDTRGKHIEKAQKLFSEANRHLKKRNQPTLGEFDQNKILAIMGQTQRLGRKIRVYEDFLRKIS